MTVPVRVCTVLALLAGVTAADANPTEAAADTGPKVSGSATGLYYAMRDQPDFAVGVASINIGALRFEGRYNYEVRDAGSLFVGWKFSGGDAVTFELTPIVGGLVGRRAASCRGSRPASPMAPSMPISRPNTSTIARSRAAATTTRGARWAGSLSRGCGLDSRDSALTWSRPAAICSAACSLSSFSTKRRSACTHSIRTLAVATRSRRLGVQF